MFGGGVGYHVRPRAPLSAQAHGLIVSRTRRHSVRQLTTKEKWGKRNNNRVYMSRLFAVSTGVNGKRGCRRNGEPVVSAQ